MIKLPSKLHLCHKLSFHHLVGSLRKCSQETSRMLPPNVLNVLMENFCPNVVRETETGTRPTTIVVEGNIGSGKTTFLDNFRHLPNTTVIAEPVSRWTHIKNKFNLLQMMYEDPKRHSFNLQTYIQLTMAECHKKPINTEFRLMERSLYSGRNCFVENLSRTGLISDVETVILDEWFHHLTSDGACPVDLFIYLRTDPRVSLERIKKRDRTGESTVTLSYLEALHQLHDDLLLNLTQSKLPTENVLVIDANKPESEVLQSFYEHAHTPRIERLQRAFK